MRHLQFSRILKQVPVDSLNFRFRSYIGFILKFYQTAAGIIMVSPFHKFLNLIYGGFLFISPHAAPSHIFAAALQCLLLSHNCLKLYCFKHYIHCIHCKTLSCIQFNYYSVVYPYKALVMILNLKYMISLHVRNFM